VFWCQFELNPLLGEFARGLTSYELEVKSVLIKDVREEGDDPVDGDHEKESEEEEEEEET